MLGSGKSAVAGLGLLLLSLGLAANSVVAETAEFVEGQHGYAGTLDTFLQNDLANAATDRGADPFAGWGGDDSTLFRSDAYTLIRFDDIIGSDAGQIPAGAKIIEAKLYLTVVDPGGTGDVHEVLIDWDDADTYSSFCGVSCEEGFQHGPAVGEAVVEAPGEIEIDVTASVQAWVNGAANFGWIIRPSAEDGDDRVFFHSSEVELTVDRPKLHVLFRDCPPDTEVTLSMPDLTTTPGATVLADVVAVPANGLAYDLTILYDPAIVEFVSISKTPLSESHTLVHNANNPGIIYIVLYGVTPLSGSGPILEIEFLVVGGFGDLTPLTFAEALVDEGLYITCTIDGSIFVCSDADGDGDGLSQCDGDCDDTNDQQFPGNPESCDGLDNNCDGQTDEGFPNTDGDAMADCVDPDDDNDGVPDVADCAPLDDTASTPPVEVLGVALHGGTPTQLSWNDQGSGFRYDLAGGWVLDIIHDQGTSGALCLAADVVLASFTDTRPDPITGMAYYYLVRSQNACGTGTYGLDTYGTPRVPAADCP